MVTTNPTLTQKKGLFKQEVIEILIILGFALFPVLFKLPFRAYVYLSWEGAYRLSEGQIPFKDFGQPLGGMYWVVPAIFFKVFGVQVFTLVKAQAFLNIVSGLVFRSILRTIGVNPIVLIPAVLLFCLSYSFQNFWPWYNHTVIVYGLLATMFAVRAIFHDSVRKANINAGLAGLFLFCSLFTKHDGGALFFVLCNCLIVYSAWREKKWSIFATYNITVFTLIVAAVAYFSNYGFSYWFNYGQKPHNSRLSVSEFADLFLTESQWLKFYFAAVVLFVLLKFRDWRSLIDDKRYMIFLLLTVGILGMAAVIQVTSYIPEFGNFFFHSFAFVFIIDSIITSNPNLDGKKNLVVSMLSLGVVVWWSGLPWQYFQRMFIPANKSGGFQLSPDGENIVGRHNFQFPAGIDKLSATNTREVEDSLKQQNRWVLSPFKTLRKVTIPVSTLEGINRLKSLEVVQQKAGKDLKVLNMTELTFLAKEIPFELERNPELPLWHHLGVGMFKKQLNIYEDRVKKSYYDVVLFEYVPYYNNFFPFEMRDYLEQYYEKVDSFAAPRSSKPGTVEVYIKKQ